MVPIEDYAVIGDCRSAALISRDGSLDWLCWPRFDSPSIFGALLDPRAGRWRIAPTAPHRAVRSYLPDTNVLRTEFRTDSGRAALTDFMPVASEEEKQRQLLPDHEIVRTVECLQGEVDLEMNFEPRPGYALAHSRWRDAGALGLRIETRGGLLVLRCSAPVHLADSRADSHVRLRAGERLQASLTFADDWPAVLPPLGAWTAESLRRTVAWWQAWVERMTFAGPWREVVARSALALKLLVFAPSGAVVAAPTTSLPERPGGDLNWDYRYCWLRDASLTVRALLGLGYAQEAEAFVSWLLHSTRLTRPELRVLYDVYGKIPARERVLGHLAGYGGARPVRTGNGAVDQLQLDVYGEVIDAATMLVRAGGVLDLETARMLRAFGEFVCRNWQRPDEGIWEPRSGVGLNTHSRVLCWVALDRVLELATRGQVRGAPLQKFRENRALLRGEVETRAWNPRLRAFTSRLDGDQLDAAVLLLPWYGFIDPADPRMRSTRARIRERLGDGPALLHRYRTDDSPGEGAFGACGFWDAEYLALGGGTAEEARRAFEALLATQNDVGLCAEEIDPASGAALGNFPQAFTHVGLINAALSVQNRLDGRLVRAPSRTEPQPEAAP